MHATRVRLLVPLLFASSALAQAPITPPCAHAVKDQSQPGNCIPASSAPTLGSLLPLGPELFVAPTGEVGIGTLAPEHALDVAGDLRAGRCAFGNDGVIGPLPGVWDWVFDLSHTITDFSTADMWTGMSSWFRIDPDQHLVGANQTWIDSHEFYVNTPQASDKDVWVLSGPLLLAEHNGSGTLENFIAGDVEAWTRGPVELQTGAYLGSIALNGGVIGDNRAVEVQSGSYGTGTIDNDHSIYVHAPYTDGSLSSHYGLFLEDQTVAGAQSWALYSRGGTSFHQGALGIGTTTPTAKLHVDGDFAATGTKSFVEPHPLDATKEIRFVCLEGNEAGTYFRGSARLAGGVAVVPVPQEFALVTESVGLTVQVTALGPGADLWVAHKGFDGIEVRGASDVAFDYVVQGVRRGYADFQVVRERVPEAPVAAPATARPDREAWRSSIGPRKLR